MKEFEDMTVGELREQNEKFKEMNPDIKTPQQLIDELNEQRARRNEARNKITKRN
jgi:hypothetical protein